MYIVLYLASRGQSVYERDAVLPVRINESLKNKFLKKDFEIVLLNHRHATLNPRERPTGSWQAVEMLVSRAGVLLPFQVPPQTLVFFLPPLKLHHPRREGKKDKRPFGPFDLLSAAFTALGGVLTLRSGGFSS